MTPSETRRDGAAPDAMEPIAPCEHMTDLVSALADGSLTGPGRWYTLFHVATCKRCKPALEALRHLRVQLQELNHSAKTADPPTLSPEHQRRLLEELDRVDRAQHEAKPTA